MIKPVLIASLREKGQIDILFRFQCARKGGEPRRKQAAFTAAGCLKAKLWQRVESCIGTVTESSQTHVLARPDIDESPGLPLHGPTSICFQIRPDLVCIFCTCAKWPEQFQLLIENVQAAGSFCEMSNQIKVKQKHQCFVSARAF